MLELTKCMAVIVTLFAALLSQTVAQGAESIGSTQAVERAVEFLRALGVESNGEPTVVPAGPPRVGAWEVNVGDDMVMDVDGSTGNVLSFMDKKALEGKLNGEVKLSESKANELAGDYIHLAGWSPADASVESSRLVRYSAAGDFNYWEVRFRRVYNGFVFHRSDYILVRLNPETGKLLLFGHNFRSPLPETTVVRITKQAAEQAARNCLAEVSIKPGRLTGAGLRIVRPNNYWTRRISGGEPEVSAVSRVAWVTHFDAPDDRIEVWVDARNGEVLGGVRAYSPKPTPPPSPIQK